ncbi:DHH family phosphoesterase [Psychroflexus aestuariivivens]|uniref:DHH family phosphoesterase n=1 Tax=Psychroflexus aestuariivivens TaxID=1795040 RepID=UPI000FDC1990|nr:bifunctional oligoribonuclease/PAP phosphatase NrnA [Psychroflexus aestuariivivens]
MKKIELNGIQDSLKSAKNICIIGHKNPDGDALGSTLALSHLLAKQGKNTVVIMPNSYPDFLNWMPGNDQILIYDKDAEKCEENLSGADLIFTLDFNHLDRTGRLGDFLKTLDKTFVMIDHHQSPDDYAKFQLVDTMVGSTCELIYDFIEVLDQKQSLDQDISTCLYTGIMTDSGSFRFPLTSSKTHRIIADLIDHGANNSKIHRDTFDNNSYSRLQLLGRALQNLKVIEALNTAYISLSQADLDEFNFKKGDTEGFVNYGLSLKGIKFAVIFIESKQENIIKISFRSKGDFDVNTFARKHYDGGGHKNAAGGKSNLALDETLIKFEEIIQQYKSDLL